MTTAVRNHIHLSTTLDGSPEFSPSYKWPIADRRDIPEVVQAFDRSLTGAPINNILTNESGPIQFQNYRFLIVVRDYDGDTVWERAAALKAMNGKAVYFVDSYHSADGEDHTNDIHTMVITRMGDFPMFNPMLERFYVDIELSDGFTVTAP